MDLYNTLLSPIESFTRKEIYYVTVAGKRNCSKTKRKEKEKNRNRNRKKKDLGRGEKKKVIETLNVLYNIDTDTIILGTTLSDGHDQRLMGKAANHCANSLLSTGRKTCGNCY